jgi:hypothetical protein
MEPVQHAVHDRREDETGSYQKHQAGEKRVQARKRRTDAQVSLRSFFSKCANVPTSARLEADDHRRTKPMIKEI